MVRPGCVRRMLQTQAAASPMNTVATLHLAITTSIMLVVAGLGMLARGQDALYLFHRPRLLISSVLSMNVVMPLVAAGFVVAFDLPLPVKIALLALAISPVPPLLPNKEANGRGTRAVCDRTAGCAGAFFDRRRPDHGVVVRQRVRSQRPHLAGAGRQSGARQRVGSAGGRHRRAPRVSLQWPRSWRARSRSSAWCCWW